MRSKSLSNLNWETRSNAPASFHHINFAFRRHMRRIRNMCRVNMRRGKVADKYNVRAMFSTQHTRTHTHVRLQLGTLRGVCAIFHNYSNCSGNLSSAMKLSASQLFLLAFFRDKAVGEERRRGSGASCGIQFSFYVGFDSE